MGNGKHWVFLLSLLASLLERPRYSADQPPWRLATSLRRACKFNKYWLDHVIGLVSSQTWHRTAPSARRAWDQQARLYRVASCYARRRSSLLILSTSSASLARSPTTRRTQGAGVWPSKRTIDSFVNKKKKKANKCSCFSRVPRILFAPQNETIPLFNIFKMRTDVVSFVMGEAPAPLKTIILFCFNKPCSSPLSHATSCSRLTSQPSRSANPFPCNHHRCP